MCVCAYAAHSFRSPGVGVFVLFVSVVDFCCLFLLFVSVVGFCCLFLLFVSVVDFCCLFLLFVFVVCFCCLFLLFGVLGFRVGGLGLRWFL